MKRDTRVQFQVEKKNKCSYVRRAIIITAIYRESRNFQFIAAAGCRVYEN